MAKRKKNPNMTAEQFLVMGAGGQFGTSRQRKPPEDAARRKHVRQAERRHEPSPDQLTDQLSLGVWLDLLRRLTGAAIQSWSVS
jgi:hypothetical protein